jgi:hypothetical protein
MSVKIRKSLVATALMGTLAIASSNVMADPLKDLHNVESQTIKAAHKISKQNR